MSRLFIKAYSDTCQNKTMTGNKKQTVEVFYGSKEKSLRAMKVSIHYLKGATLPIIEVAVKGEIRTFLIKGELESASRF